MLVEDRHITVRYIVEAGSGIYGNKGFTDFDTARKHYDKEKNIPSYMGGGRKRQVSLTKVTTIVEVLY